MFCLTDRHTFLVETHLLVATLGASRSQSWVRVAQSEVNQGVPAGHDVPPVLYEGPGDEGDVVQPYLEVLAVVLAVHHPTHLVPRPAGPVVTSVPVSEAAVALVVAPPVQPEALRPGWPGLGSPEQPALGLVGAALAGVTEALPARAGQTRGLVKVRGTVGRLPVTALSQVALTGGGPALCAGRGEGAAGEVAAPAGAAGGARGEAAGLGVTAGSRAVRDQATVTLLPGLQEPVATHRTSEYLNSLG